MILLKPVQLQSNHNIFHFGDLHDGSVLSYRKGWDKLCNMMHSEYDGCSNNYGVEGGDPFEAIMVDDKRYSPEKLRDPETGKSEALPLAQLREAVKIREPIKHMMLTMLDGNHTRKLWRFGDMTADICLTLGIPYGTYTAKITIQDTRGNLMYKEYVTHGFKNITSTADDPKRRRANMELILKRHLRHKAGDCVVMVKHHTHKLLVCKPEPELFLTDDGKQIKQGFTGWGQAEEYIHPDARWYGNAGSFLRLFGKGVSGYAEIFEYDPVELGFLVLIVRNKRIVELKKIPLGV
ncbi:hypothetical protein LCGC14_0420530 [marine sediment metagenome]|uniref:Calcineurin-like phosphoesterase domain-containing protein n=1 Tax=marine sediment metagenome TaxID=412755 RepID=A0A0F9SX50_9ZZZZ